MCFKMKKKGTGLHIENYEVGLILCMTVKTLFYQGRSKSETLRKEGVGVSAVCGYIMETR